MKHGFHWGDRKLDVPPGQTREGPNPLADPLRIDTGARGHHGAGDFPTGNVPHLEPVGRQPPASNDGVLKPHADGCGSNQHLAWARVGPLHLDQGEPIGAPEFLYGYCFQGRILLAVVFPAPVLRQVTVRSCATGR